MVRTWKTIAAGAAAIAAALVANAQTPVLETNAEIGITEAVFLRNLMYFTDDRFTGGASSTFVEYDGKVCVLTAKHLLTSSMGISPSVIPSNFEKELEAWILFSNPDLYDSENAQPLAYVTGMIRPDDDFGNDFMLLETNGDRIGLAGMTVPIARELPVKGEPLFVIGCPYSDQAGCIQKIYSGNVSGTSEGEFSFSWNNAPDKLSGFSGGVVLNGQGEAMGVVYGGSRFRGIATSLPEWLRLAEEPKIEPYEFGDLGVKEAKRLEDLYTEIDEMLAPYILVHGQDRLPPDYEVLSEGLVKLDELIEAVPGHWSAYAMIGKIYQTVGNYQSALRAYQIAYSINPDDIGIVNEMTISAVELGMFDYVKPIVESELEKRPGTLSLQARLALIALLTGELDDAVKNADLALEIAPGDSISTSIRAFALEVKNGDRPQPNSIADLY